MDVRCSQCLDYCDADDNYSECCNEPVIIGNNIDISGADDGRGHVYSDAEFDAPGF